MYLFKKGCCFECGRIAVSVPENYCLDGTPADSDGDILYFCTPDKSFRVSYEMQYRCNGTKEAMLQTQSELRHSYQACSPIEEVEHNGLKGYQFTYGKRVRYYEARFLIEETDEGSTEFVFTINAKERDIEEIKASPEFKELLDGIR